MFNIKIFSFASLAMALAALLAVAPPSFAEQQQSVGNEFIEAFGKNDQAAMESIVKNRAEEVPAEVQAMVEYSLSPDATPEDQDFLFNVAGTMASIYAEVSGDERLLGAVQLNYENMMKKRQANALSPEAVEKVKKELAALGGPTWKIVNFKMVEGKGLTIDIDIRDNSTSGETPRVAFKTGKKAAEIVKKELPGVGGRISWSSMGVGLKTVFLE